MGSVRDIRNASVHSNCLINKLFEELPATQQPDAEITEYVKRIKIFLHRLELKFEI